MAGRLKVAIADDEPDTREFLRETLTDLGHEVVAVAETGKQLVELCRDARPDLVITDIKMPGMDGIDAAHQICRDYPTPVILVSAYHESELVERSLEEHVMSYLVKPVKSSDLEPAIALAMRRFEQFQELRMEAHDLRQALADRKTIERAKGFLMKRSGLSEQDAFKRLQRLASDKNLKLAAVAQMLVTADEALG